MAPWTAWARVLVGVALAWGPRVAAAAPAVPAAFFEGARVSSFACSAPVRCLSPDLAQPGAVWVGTDGGYLLHVTAAGAVTPFGPGQGVSSRSILRVAVTSAATAVLGGDGVLAVRDGERSAFAALPLAPVADLAAVDGEVWLSVRDEPFGLRRLPLAAAEAGQVADLSGGGSRVPWRFASGAGRLLAYRAGAVAELLRGQWRVLEAPSLRHALGGVVVRDFAAFLDASGRVCVLRDGALRSLDVTGLGGASSWRLLEAEGHAWVAVGEGLLRSPERDAGAWRCYVGRPGGAAPRGVTCAVERAGHGWFGTLDGSLWEHLAADDAWRLLGARQGVPDGAVRALAESGGVLWAGGDGGLARLAPGANYLEAVRLPGGPPGPFVAAAALVSGDLVLGDGRWLHRLTPAGTWVPRVVEVPARWLVPGEGDAVWCVDSSEAVEWGVNPARRLDFVPLTLGPLVALAAEAGLLFPATRGAVARLDLRARRLQPDFWTAPAPFRVARGRWLTTVLSALAADGKGIVGGTPDGTIIRLAGFNPTVALGNLGAFSSPRRAVRALAVCGASLFAGLDGEGPPLWELTPAGAWRALPWPMAAGGPPRQLAPFGGGLAALAPAGIVLVSPAAGRAECIDGSRAAGAADAAALAVSGRRLWVAGHGVAVVELLAGSAAR